MYEDFIPFELAKKLKEKRFNKPCVAYYLPNSSELYFNTAILLKESTVEDCLFSNNTKPIGYICSIFIDAPTISQVLKWLREEKNIHIVIDITNYGFVNSIISFKWDKSYCENEIEHYDHKGYSIYEEAAIAGIDYVINNLI